MANLIGHVQSEADILGQGYVDVSFTPAGAAMIDHRFGGAYALNATQSLGNSVPVAVAFDTPQAENDGGIWSSATPTRLTAIITDVHLLNASITFVTPSGAFNPQPSFQAAFRVNGSGPLYGLAATTVAKPSSGTALVALSLTAMIQLNVGDYVEVIAECSVGGYPSNYAYISNTPNYTGFSLYTADHDFLGD